jgi:hypothetical protein
MTIDVRLGGVVLGLLLLVLAALLVFTRDWLYRIWCGGSLWYPLSKKGHNVNIGIFAVILGTWGLGIIIISIVRFG